jgi:hypothetical protein
MEDPKIGSKESMEVLENLKDAMHMLKAPAEKEREAGVEILKTLLQVLTGSLASADRSTRSASSSAC